MRVTNIIREKISITINKQYNKAISELLADEKALEASLRKQLDAIVDEANAKAREVLAQAPAGSYFSRYGSQPNFIQETAGISFPR